LKVPYVSIDNAILEFIEDIDFDLSHGEVPERLLKRWANDCLRWISTEEQLSHRVAVIQIHNTRGEFPKDFKYLAQAAAHPWYEHDECDCEHYPEHDCCHHHHDHHHHDHYHDDHYHNYHHHHHDHKYHTKSRREDIVQWTKNAFEKDCELEINLICPICKTSDCNCDSGSVEIDVDRIWEMAHPEIYYRNYNKIGRVGYGHSPHSSYYCPKFKLMRYATGDYFNAEHVLTHCPNVRCTNCLHKFIIDLPYIEVDFKRGEVLLSYLGKQMDKDGNLLIPDHPSVFAAINSHLQYKWFYKNYLRTSDQSALQKSQLAQQNRELEIGIANSALGMPDYSQFHSWMEQNLMRRIPDRNHQMNANELTLDPSIRYNNVLEGKSRRKHR
jgi:hypothetical protein